MSHYESQTPSIVPFWKKLLIFAKLSFLLGNTGSGDEGLGGIGGKR